MGDNASVVTEKVAQVLNKYLGVESAFGYGVVAGVAGIVVLLLLVWLIRKLAGVSNKCKGITVEGDHGDLFVTVGAVREFVKRTLAEYDDASLHNIRLREIRNTLIMEVELDVHPDTDLVPLRDSIQNTILRDVSEKIGAKQSVRINLHVRSLESGGRKAAKRSSSIPPASGVSAANHEEISAQEKETSKMPIAVSEEEKAGAAGDEKKEEEEKEKWGPGPSE